MEVASMEVALTPESVFAEAAEATGWLSFGSIMGNGCAE